MEMVLTKCQCECLFATSGESRVRKDTRSGQDTRTHTPVAGWLAGKQPGEAGESEREEGTWTQENRQQKSTRSRLFEKIHHHCLELQITATKTWTHLTPTRPRCFFACRSGVAAADQQSPRRRKPTEPSSPQKETRLRD